MSQEPQPSLDEILRAALLARFAADEHTEFACLRVGVINGIAHLTGFVPSLESYVAAAELVEGVPGIRGVVNRIEAPGAPSPSRTIDLNLQPEDQRKTQGDAK